MVAGDLGTGPLRIAFVVDRFPAISETFILNQITGLLDRGHSVDIVTGTITDDTVIHPDVKQYNLLARTRAMTIPGNLLMRAAKGAGLLITRLPRHPALLRALDVRRYGRPALSLRVLYKATPFLTRYDIVHCQYGTNGESVGALVKNLGLQRKLVTTFHRYDLRLAEQDGGSFFRELRRQGDCFLSISNHTRQRLLQFGFDPAKIVYHPVGIDTCRFQPVSRTPGDQVRVATVARLVPEKGLRTGILAVAELLRERPRLQLRYDIVGGGPLLSELMQLIGSLGLRDVARLHGPLAQNEVIEVLRGSDVFLLPSLDEVLPVSLMEAQAMGLPAVVSNVAATDEIVRDERSGFLVPVGDVAAMVSKLRLLIERPSLRVEFGEYGRRHVAERFDINLLNDRLVEIYRSILARDALTGLTAIAAAR